MTGPISSSSASAYKVSNSHSKNFGSNSSNNLFPEPMNLTDLTNNLSANVIHQVGLSYHKISNSKGGLGSGAATNLNLNKLHASNSSGVSQANYSHKGNG